MCVPLLQVFNISVSYNAILGVILAFAAAIASRIILDELSMWEKEYSHNVEILNDIYEVICMLFAYIRD